MNGKKKKKAEAKAGGSLLSRWLKTGKGDDKKGHGKKAAPGKAAAKTKAQTPLDRSIQEIKHMAKVGESDPERLAMLLSRLLGQEKEKQRSAQEDFDRMIWDIVHKDESNDADGPAIS